MRGGYRLHTAFQMLLVIVLFLSIYPMIINPIQSLTTRWFNRYGRQLDYSLNEIEKRLPEVLSIDNLEKMVLHRIHEAGLRRPVALRHRSRFPMDHHVVVSCLSGRQSSIRLSTDVVRVSRGVYRLSSTPPCSAHRIALTYV